VNSVDKLTEMCACEHVRVTWQPIVTNRTPHAWVRTMNIYIVIEEGKVKIVCSLCFRRSLDLALTRSESH
jgi:hypothetical protein